ncbi:MAG: MIP family channel protein [Candidatus Tectomicrobia bacterium]
MLETSRREFTSLEAWRSTLAEFIATLLFVFLGAGSVIVSGGLPNGDLDPARLVAIALAHGVAIAFLVYATANISGGHLNPAVTFAALLTKKISAARGLMFVVAQLGGAVVGALLLLATIPGAADTNLGAHALGPDVSVGMGLLMEIVITFALVFVIFATAVDPRGMGNLAPLAIGLTVLADHLLAVPITGASMNPARSFGPALVSGEWAGHWLYWAGPLLGGALAGLVYQIAFINRPR